MSLPPLPLLLYGEPLWFPSPRKVHIYLAEKQLGAHVVEVVPHTDPEASKAYPPIPGKAMTQFTGPTVPKLAVAKRQTSTGGNAARSTKQDDYIWLTESAAIIEYLEDLCDAHPQLSSGATPSLRHGDDPLRRCQMRAQLVRAESLWTIAGLSLVLGSQAYNEMSGKESTVHIPSARAVVQTGHRITLDKLDEQLTETVDLAGLAADAVGAATIADISLYTTLHWYRVGHGVELAAGFPNLERFMQAWAKRKSRSAGIPAAGYPDMILPFRTGFKEEVWPAATVFE